MEGVSTFTAGKSLVFRVGCGRVDFGFAVITDFNIFPDIAVNGLYFFPVLVCMESGKRFQEVLD